MDLRINGYHIRGTYTPARANFKCGTIRDTPPEAAEFSIEAIVDPDLDPPVDILATLSPSIVRYLEREALRQIRDAR